MSSFESQLINIDIANTDLKATILTTAGPFVALALARDDSYIGSRAAERDSSRKYLSNSAFIKDDSHAKTRTIEVVNGCADIIREKKESGYQQLASVAWLPSFTTIESLNEKELKSIGGILDNANFNPCGDIKDMSVRQWGMPRIDVDVNDIDMRSCIGTRCYWSTCVYLGFL